jgi:hypothetical protein
VAAVKPGIILALCGIMHADSGKELTALITKRLVGIALGLFGLAIVLGTVGVDLIGAGKWGGLGPAQQLAIKVGLVISLIGLSLIPLGNRPA